MRTVRRLYVYLLSLISFEVVIWGAVNLLRTIVGNELVSGSTTLLATGLSLVLVGLPIFFLHWRSAQMDALRDVEERGSRLRAIFLYAVRVGVLIPVVYSLLALLNRLLAQVLGMTPAAALFGANQTNTDNLIAVAVNLVALAYFARVLQGDWESAPAGNFLAETRRLYRYLWVMFGLVVSVAGLQNILRFLLQVPRGLLDTSGSLLANGLALTLVGLPLWVWTWNLVQAGLKEEGEQQSILRLVVLYLINLAAVVGVLSAGGNLLSATFQWLFGKPQTLGGFLDESGGAAALLITLGVLWAYFGGILDREMAALPDEPRRAAVRRLYRSILAMLGLATVFTGILTLCSFLVSLLFSGQQFGGSWQQLSSGLAALAVGLPLWLANWPPLQVEAAARTDTGDRARRSVVRKAYLYLVVFLLVVGGMGVAGVLLYNLLSALLGSPVMDLPRLVADRLLILGVVLVFLAYHWQGLRRDVRLAQQALGSLHASYPVVVFTRAESHFGEEFQEALRRQSPGVPVVLHPIENGVPAEELFSARAVILPAGLAVDPPEALRLWLANSRARRILVPEPQADWVWLGVPNRSAHELAQEAALAVRQIAEGESPRAGLPSSPWAVAGYLLGGLFALQLLVGLFALVISSLFD